MTHHSNRYRHMESIVTAHIGGSLWRAFSASENPGRPERVTCGRETWCVRASYQGGASVPQYLTGGALLWVEGGRKWKHAAYTFRRYEQRIPDRTDEAAFRRAVRCLYWRRMAEEHLRDGREALYRRFERYSMPEKLRLTALGDGLESLYDRMDEPTLRAWHDLITRDAEAVSP